MKPIQRIQISIKPKPDFRGPIDLSVDNRSIAETIGSHFHQSTRKAWPEKEKCYVSAESLRASALSSGRHAIVICANCAQSGYPSCDDLGLLPIEVGFADNTVTWLIEWAATSQDTVPPLKLIFDKSEYDRETKKLAI